MATTQLKIVIDRERSDAVLAWANRVATAAKATGRKFSIPDRLLRPVTRKENGVLLVHLECSEWLVGFAEGLGVEPLP